MSIDSAEFRNALGRFGTGVAIVTTMDEGRPVGVTVSSFCSVSLDPPLVLFCLGRQSLTHAAFERVGRFAVNFLAEDQRPLSDRFASRAEDKWAGVAFDAGAETGCPLLPGALATLECARETIYEGGDHWILLGRVLKTGLGEDRAPLLHFRGRYRQLGGEL